MASSDIISLYNCLTLAFLIKDCIKTVIIDATQLLRAPLSQINEINEVNKISEINASQ